MSSLSKVSESPLCWLYHDSGAEMYHIMGMFSGLNTLVINTFQSASLLWFPAQICPDTQWNGDAGTWGLIQHEGILVLTLGQFIKHVLTMCHTHYILPYHWWHYTGLAALCGDTLAPWAKMYRQPRMTSSHPPNCHQPSQRPPNNVTWSRLSVPRAPSS